MKRIITLLQRKCFKKISFLLLLITITVLPSKAQNFIKILKNTGDDVAFKVISEKSNYLYVCGQTTENSIQKAFVMKLNSSTGNIVWSNTYTNTTGLDSRAMFRDIIKVGASTLFACGTATNGANTSSFIAKINSNDGSLISEANYALSSDITSSIFISYQKNLLFVSSNNNSQSDARSGFLVLDLNLNLYKNYKIEPTNSDYNITGGGYAFYLLDKKYVGFAETENSAYDPAIFVSDTNTYGTSIPVISASKKIVLSPNYSDAVYKINKTYGNNLVLIGPQRQQLPDRLGAFFMVLDRNNITTVLKHKNYNFNTTYNLQDRQFRVDDFHTYVTTGLKNNYLIPITEIPANPLIDSDMGYFTIDENGVIINKLLINSGVGIEDVSYGACLSPDKVPVVVGYSKVYGDKDIFIAKTNGSASNSEIINCIFETNFLTTNDGTSEISNFPITTPNDFSSRNVDFSYSNFTYPSIPNCFCYSRSESIINKEFSDENTFYVSANPTNINELLITINGSIKSGENLLIYKEMNDQIELIKTLNYSDLQVDEKRKLTDQKYENSTYYYQISEPLIDLGIPNSSSIEFYNNKKIKDNWQTDEVSLYPAPVHEILNVKFKTSIEGAINYEIIDSNGKNIFSNSIANKNSSLDNFIINVKSLSNGLYLIKLNVINKEHNLRFSISK